MKSSVCSAQANRKEPSQGSQGSLRLASAEVRCVSHRVPTGVQVFLKIEVHVANNAFVQINGRARASSVST